VPEHYQDGHGTALIAAPPRCILCNRYFPSVNSVWNAFKPSGRSKMTPQSLGGSTRSISFDVLDSLFIRATNFKE
jgi:hypothetical protein